MNDNRENIGRRLGLTWAVGPMLNALSASRHLPDEDKRRIIALEEKRRLFAMIDQYGQPQRLVPETARD